LVTPEPQGEVTVSPPVKSSVYSVHAELLEDEDFELEKLELLSELEELDQLELLDLDSELE
jgi:hypothetical protein